MNILITVIVGGIVGWLGSILMKTSAQMGLLANIIVGIVGSNLGFWLAGQLNIAGGNTIVRWVIAVAGAMVLIFILKVLKIFK